MLTFKKTFLLWLCLLIVAGSPTAWAQENLPAIVKRISPAVVVVETQKGNKKGLGTGFFINSRGQICHELPRHLRGRSGGGQDAGRSAVSGEKDSG